MKPRIKSILNMITLMTLLAVLIGSAAFPINVHAFGNTIQVTTIADTASVDSQCSLREAITNANDNALTYPECLYGATGSFIVFDTTLGTATITLTSSLPAITDIAGLTIHGGGYITISGNNSYRVFTVNSGVPFTLDSLTVTNGRATSDCIGFNGNGSGVFNEGTLTIQNSTFSNNNAVANGLCGGNGGGVYNHGGTLIINNSTFSGNTADESGGGVYNSGTLTINKSTFLSNVSTSDWGGGGVFNLGPLTITNSTFGGNSASGGNNGGGLYNYTGTATLTNNTFSANSAQSGGGIYNFSSAATLDMYNTILANSLGGGDCVNNLGTVHASYNINEDNSNGCGLPIVGLGANYIGNDPGLSSLYSWEPPAYFPLPDNAFAIDKGDDTKCLGAFVNNTSQNGMNRQQGAHCDIGSYERDLTAPTVLSSVRANSNPTSATSVNFTVTFSESVSGVDTADFTLTTTGSISGAAVTNAVGSGTTSAVTVNTGSGSGTIRLDLVDNDSIVDLTSTPLGGGGTGNGNFTTGEFYDITHIPDIRSSATQDGWILESTETSNIGGTLNSTAATFNLGDDAADKQYRAILHFDTSSLPDTAVITKATLKIKKQGLVGTDPFTALGGLQVDMRKPSFGAVALAPGDFQAPAGRSTATTFGVTPVSNWYSAVLNGSGRNYVNKTGNTQFRLQFATDDNDDNVADFMRFFSGNAPAASAPQLIIEYTVP